MKIKNTGNKIFLKEPLKIHMNITTRDIQELMNDTYWIWQNTEAHVDKHQILDKLTEYHRLAVCFGNMNYQVCNGGFSQWIGNGYALEDIEIIWDFLNKAKIIKKYKDNKDIDLLIELLNNFYSEIIEFKHRGYMYTECEDCDGNGYYEEEDDNNDMVETECYNCHGTGEMKSTNFNWDFRLDNYIGDKLDQKYYSIEWLELFQSLVNDYEIVVKN